MHVAAEQGVFTSLEGAVALPRWFPMVFRILLRIEIGSLEVQLPDGRVFRAAGAAPGPEGRVVVHNRRLFGRMLRQGAMGFAEAYVDGWWSTPDLQAVLDVCLLNNDRVARGLPKSGLSGPLDRLRHWWNRNTKGQARRNIEAHYDLGNAFYGMWLDDSMTYSSALYETGDESLEEAQRAKYRAMCDGVGLRQGDHVLEIGCGWGGFAEYAARERGARVTGLTISPAQLAFAQERIRRQGLQDRVTLALRDYRDERARYDAVVSIEMFEAVGERYWPTYFGQVRDRLRSGGRACLQVITIDDALFDRYRGGVDFVQKHIFPGGMLPSVSAFRAQADAAGLQWDGATAFGASYSETLRDWRRRFEAAWGEIQTLPGDRPFDARFRRMWNFYLAVCAACFRAGTTDVIQASLRRT